MGGQNNFWPVGWCGEEGVQLVYADVGNHGGGCKLEGVDEDAVQGEYCNDGSCGEGRSGHGHDRGILLGLNVR